LFNLVSSCLLPGIKSKTNQRQEGISSQRVPGINNSKRMILTVNSIIDDYSQTALHLPVLCINNQIHNGNYQGLLFAGFLFCILFNYETHRAQLFFGPDNTKLQLILIKTASCFIQTRLFIYRVPYQFQAIVLMNMNNYRLATQNTGENINVLATATNRKLVLITRAPIQFAGNE
jgi:hypothetical protein